MKLFLKILLVFSMGEERIYRSDTGYQWEKKQYSGCQWLHLTKMVHLSRGAAVESHSFQNVLLTLGDYLTVRRPSQLSSEQDSLCAHMRPSPHNYYKKSFCHNRLFKGSPLRDELSVSPWTVHQNYQLCSGHIFLNIQGV